MDFGRPTSVAIFRIDHFFETPSQIRISRGNLRLFTQGGFPFICPKKVRFLEDQKTTNQGWARSGSTKTQRKKVKKGQEIR